MFDNLKLGVLGIDPAHYNVSTEADKAFLPAVLMMPRYARKGTYTLYSFMRSVDNLVDGAGSDPEELQRFKHDYYDALEGKPSGNPVIDDFADISKRFRPVWMEQFFDAMETDQKKAKYETFCELESYFRGSSEVVMLMMAKMMGLSEKTYEAAESLGKKLQLINIIRDVHEDYYEHGRMYLPQDELTGLGLKDLSEEEVMLKDNEYDTLIRSMKPRIDGWSEKIRDGLEYVPFRERAAVIAADNVYQWIFDKILEEPVIWYWDMYNKPQPDKKLLKRFKEDAVQRSNAMPFSYGNNF